ncbi:acyltransferase [Brevibacterium litoralis]|uniref:acyltransferase n=1 Tax=Brevibacterium litoralis TaxID=3138935 RepID=UPI0032EB4E67
MPRTQTTPEPAAENRTGSDHGWYAPPRQGHRPDVDAMRIAACLTVMLGHAGGVLVRRSREDSPERIDGFWPDSAAGLVGHLAEAVNPWAVPLFFMIAGWATFVGAPPRHSGAVRRRVVRHIVPLGFWTVAYTLAFNLFDTDAVDVKGVLLQALTQSGRPAFHLWYLYQYIPLVLVLGTLVVFMRGRRPWGLAIGCAAVSGMSALWPILDQNTVWELGSWGWRFGIYQVVYFVIGGFLIYHARSIRVPWPVLGIVFAASAFGVYLQQSAHHYPITNSSPLCALLAACVILGLARIDWSPRAAALLARLASASFGAFLVHVFVLEFFFQRWFPVEAGLPTTLGLFLVLWLTMATIAFALSFLFGRLRLRPFLG